MILGDCVLLGESSLDADVWKPGYDRPCAVVIWGGWCVLLGSIKPSLAAPGTPPRMYLRPKFPSRLLTYMYL